MHRNVEMYRTDPQICSRSGDPPPGGMGMQRDLGVGNEGADPANSQIPLSPM